MTAYTTVKSEATAEFVEKRSRFIGSIRPIEAGEEAAAFIAGIKSAHYDAAHNCSAYFLRSGVQRYSDDGEPQGTAGIPILEVLRRENVVDTVIVVTRYFGGVLLGAGGLVRAYSHAAKLALDAAGKLEMQPCTVFSIEVPYPLYDRVNLMLSAHGIVTLDSGFGAAVTLKLRVSTQKLERFASEITEFSAGQIIPRILREEFA